MTHIFGRGYLGVDLFFILSGFVISYNYWDDFRRVRPRQYGKFLWLRLARIYPVHLFALVLSLVFLAGATALGVRTRSDLHDWTASSFAANLLLVHHWTLKPSLSWNGPSWSISCEWFAYLLFPFLVKSRLDRLRPLLKWTVAAGSLFVLGAVFQWATGHGLVRICCGFLTGCILFLLFRETKLSARSASMIAGSGVIGFAALVAISARVPGISDYWAAPAFALLIYGLASGSGVIARVLSNSWAVKWGRASYSLYMTHGLTAILLGKLLPLSSFYGASVTVRVAVGCAWVLMFGCVAMLTYAYVEEPARHWMRKLPSRLRARKRRPEYQTAGAVLGEIENFG